MKSSLIVRTTCPEPRKNIRIAAGRRRGRRGRGRLKIPGSHINNGKDRVI